MVEDKKNEEEKAITKRKASAGAWWKSTEVEEGQQSAEQAADVKSMAGGDSPAESSEKKPPRKRSPRKKSTPDSGDVLSDASTQEAVAEPPTPPKRSPRKKKEPAKPLEAVVGPTAVDSVVPQSVPEGDSIPAITQASDDASEPVKSTKQARKRPARKKKAVENVVAEPVVERPNENSSDVEVFVKVPELTEDPNGEVAPLPKRTPRKRPPRKKKPVATVAGTVVDEKMTVSPEDVILAENPAPVLLNDKADGQSSEAHAEPSETVKRSSRKRSHRKKKSAGSVAAESVAGATAAAEVEDQAGSAEKAGLAITADNVSVGEVGAETPSATEGGDTESGQEVKKRRPSNRRSRGRRKGPAKQVEAPVVVEQVEEDLDDDWSDVDDDDFDDDDDFENRSGRDRRDGYRSSINAQDSDADFPELPEGDEADEEKENTVLKLLINAEEPEECRLALLENGRLESIHVSTINRTQTKNNIYKARIVAIEPNLQAAFVDYGTEKNGFLPFSEIHPEYYKENLSEDIQKLVETHHWKKLSITDVMEKGQDVLVQVVKEEVGKKGANMTTYLSLPGRSVVLMPGSDSSGISRKISGEERRAQLRTAMSSLGIPEGIGWIVRTAGVDITRSALTRDVGYLLRLWEEIKKKAQDMEGVGQVYEDHQSVLRFLREHFDPAIEEILVDDEGAMEQVKEFVSLLPSKQRDVKVRLHKGSRPIFNQYSVEDQIESIYQPRVSLPSGGSIVIEPTEALVSIDVNSGSTSKGKNFDQSIYQANLEAASELARQLRLRDLGGLIIVDFIDMRNKKHIRDVERMVKVSMKRDKAKVDLSRISKFGLMQISRQKLGSPIEAGNYRVCQHCKGRGTVRSVETLALFYLRRIQTAASRKHVGRVECHFPLDVAQYLLNKKRHEILEHETRYDTEIMIIGNPAMSPAEHEITLHKAEKEPIEKKQG